MREKKSFRHSNNTVVLRVHSDLERELNRMKNEMEGIFGKEMSIREVSKIYAKVNSSRVIVLKEKKNSSVNQEDYAFLYL